MEFISQNGAPILIIVFFAVLGTLVATQFYIHREKK